MKTRNDDKRGAKPMKPEGRADPAERVRKGTEHEGKRGNLPHVRNEQAASLVEMLTGFGIKLDDIGLTIERQLGPGYSDDTIRRHYAPELARGKAVALSNLMQRAHQMAMMEKIPQGVSPDKAYEIASRKINFLLNIVHNLPGSMAGGGVINITISGDDAEL